MGLSQETWTVRRMLLSGVVADLGVGQPGSVGNRQMLWKASGNLVGALMLGADLSDRQQQTPWRPDL